jgi:Protein of unknown function (DUF664)
MRSPERLAAGDSHHVPVSDQLPPRVAGGERDVLGALLQFQRESLLRKLDGVDASAARRALVGSGTTLLWLVKHLARMELTWLAVRFAGLDTELPDDTVLESDTVESLSARYRNATARADEIIAAASLDDLCQRAPGDQPLPLRWVVAHLLEETARHAGHADILRELIDGSTGR